jgi:5-methylcytosine-specific restriction endonuclease McrA
VKRSGIRRSTPEAIRAWRNRTAKPLPQRSARKQTSDAEWHRVRELVLRRSGYGCEVHAPGCTVRAVHVHHRLPRSQGGTHDPRWLLATCRHCHLDVIHANPKWAYKMGWLVKASDIEKGAA